jgi:hypothetical protein
VGCLFRGCKNKYEENYCEDLKMLKKDVKISPEQAVEAYGGCGC